MNRYPDNWRLFALLLLSIMTIFVTGCSRSTDRTSVNADSKNEISRIISAAPSNTEIIVALGMGERLIAADRYSRDIQGMPADLPLIDFFYPDTEAIIGLEPDLILVNEINSFGVADNPFKLLGDLGIRVVQVPTSSSIEGIYSDIIMIADVLRVNERGEALVNLMRNEIESIAATRGEATERKRVYFEVSPEPTMVSFGQGAYLNEMIEIAGGENIFAEQKGWFSPAAEEIINRNPDIIFALAYPGEDPVPQIRNRGAFEGITAVRENQIYPIDADSASRPSQNIMLALREMIRVISPSL